MQVVSVLSSSSCVMSMQVVTILSPVPDLISLPSVVLWMLQASTFLGTLKISYYSPLGLTFPQDQICLPIEVHFLKSKSFSLE